MKLSWKDVATTAFLLAGGAVVYAKFYDYSWAFIGSWRGAAAVLGALGLGLLLSSIDYEDSANNSVAEILVGLVGLSVAAIGIIVASEMLFYVAASILGVYWLADISRHVWHSMGHGDDTASFQRPSAVS